MKVKSCYSGQLDAYRAGIEIGESLTEIQPEVIFIFPTIHYGNRSELTEAIYDVLESDDTLIFGNTGDGFYEYNKVAGVGVAAMGLNSSGALNWHVAVESDIMKKPFESMRSCIEKLHAMCDSESVKVNFLTVSNYRIATAKIILALNEYTSAPVVGGIAGGDSENSGGFLYVNRHVYTDSLALLGVSGNINFDIQIAHTLQPVGEPGKITKSSGTLILTIDEIPAMTFIEKKLGKSLDRVDQGVITFRLTDETGTKDPHIRSIILNKNTDLTRTVDIYGGFETGNYVQVCLAPPEYLINDVNNLRKIHKELAFDPSAALIVSCSGRKSVLVDDIESEVSEVLRQYPSIQALAGYPSYGEFAPVKQDTGYSKSLFHNMTYVLLLLGETAA